MSGRGHAMPAANAAMDTRHAIPVPDAAMSARERILSVLLLVVALLFLTCPVLAAPARTSRGTAARDSATAVGSGGARRERGSLAASRAPRRHDRTNPQPADRPKVAPRTLDDIHIEGEIPVPQVLFITARDQRRFLEFQHHRYRRTSLELGRATPTPSRIVVTAPPSAPRKESE